MQRRSLLDTLSDDEQRQLLTMLSAKFGGQSIASVETAESDLWDQLNEALSIRASPSLQGFRSTFGVGAFAEAARSFEQFVNDAIPAVTRKPIRRLVGISMLQSLARHLASRDLAPAYSMMLRNLDRLAYAVDLDWPGYARCRLMHMAVGHARS